MRFVVDAQLPPALARMLDIDGHHANTLRRRPAGADDSSTLRYTVEHQAVMVTKDEDFPHRFRQGGTDRIVLSLRIGNTSRRALLEWFEPLLPQVETMIAQSERLIEVR